MQKGKCEYFLYDLKTKAIYVFRFDFMPQSERLYEWEIEEFV